MADAAEPSELLTTDAVRLGCTATDRFDAVRQAGELLIGIGAIEPAYAEAMQERERSLSSFVGEGFAIPHGTDESRVHIKRAAVAFLQFPDGIEWDADEDEHVSACLAIAAKSEEHVTVMAQLARILVEPDQAEELRTTQDPDRVVELLAPREVAEEEEPEPAG